MFNFLKSIIFKQDSIQNSEYNAAAGAIQNSIDTLHSDVALIKDEMVIPTSTGSWLDTYGNWFGVTRLAGETDSAYSSRIIASTTFPKDTVSSIIAAANRVAGYTGNGTTLYEPWNNIFKHSKSKFSGKDVLEDGTYWLSGTIDLITPYPVTDSIRTTVNSVKAAGVQVFFTVMNNMDLSGDTASFNHSFTPTFFMTINYEIPMPKYQTGHLFDSNIGYKPTRSGNQSVYPLTVAISSL